MTDDSWVLQTVKGYKIIFDSVPLQHVLPKEINFSEHEQPLVDKEISNLIDEGAVYFSTHESGGFYIKYFSCKKPEWEV